MSHSQIWLTPFLDESHRQLADRLLAWDIPAFDEENGDFATAGRKLLRAMADEGLLDLVVPRGDSEPYRVDLRAVCLAREILAYRAGGFPDSMFVMQGIGTAALWMTGDAALCDRYLSPAREGRTIAAFGLTEPEAGSDIANLTSTARHDGGDYVLNGEKVFITNAGIADHYVIVARTGEAPGARGLSAFMIDADTPGLVTERAEFIAPHCGGGLKLENCRIPASAMIGAPGQGFKLSMATFDMYRASVGAAAIGMARRALDETLARVKQRRLFGKPMAEIEGIQMKLAEMAADLDAAGLLVYRAAWAKDTTGQRSTREVSMAKLQATEAAQRVIDASVQIFGGLGVTRGCIVEKLYREIRPMRIYEGASEVQKLIIARDLIGSTK